MNVEAKPAKKRLDDPKWVSQTINYANNEGVVWCVLTDGLRWRVFKANEPAPMEQKLAFEVLVDDLFDDDTRDRAESLFSHLTPAAVADGELQRLGTQVFVDTRVREALVSLLDDPHKKVVELIRAQLGADGNLKPADIRGALARVSRPAIDALSHPPTAVLTSSTSTDGSTPLLRPIDTVNDGTVNDGTVNHDTADDDTDKNPTSDTNHHHATVLSDLVTAGLLPAGTRLRSANSKWPAEALVTPDHQIEWNGQRYESPSAAASAVKEGAAVNGWKFWETTTETGSEQLCVIRERYEAGLP